VGTVLDDWRRLFSRHLEPLSIVILSASAVARASKEAMARMFQPGYRALPALR